VGYLIFDNTVINKKYGYNIELARRQYRRYQLVLFKVFLSSLGLILHTNKHGDIINSIVSALSGFLTKKLSAKNCGSMINQQTTFTTLLVFIIPEYFWV
jgi:hypothetical protein